MEFTDADYTRAVELVRTRLDQVQAHTTHLHAAAHAAATLPGLPDALARIVLDDAALLLHVAERLIVLITEALEGVSAPLLMFSLARRWIDVQGSATAIAGQLRPDQLPAHTHWKGLAADRYTAAITTQSLAASRIGPIAAAATHTLDDCAGAGLAFYAFLGYVLAQLITALIACTAATETGVGAPAGLLAALQETVLSAGTIGLALSALAALIGTQATTVNQLRAQLADHTQFPAGHWPRAVADTYTDATVTDGDAKWSVMP